MAKSKTGFIALFVTVCFTVVRSDIGGEATAHEHEHGEVAKEQAQFFANILFKKYGDNESLSFEGFEHLVENLGIGNLFIQHQLNAHYRNGTFSAIHVTHKHPPDDEEGEGDHDHGGETAQALKQEAHAHTFEMGHGRRAKRHSQPAQKKRRRCTRHAPHEPEDGVEFTAEEQDVMKQCLTPDQLLRKYDVNVNDTISIETFYYLCPAIVLQLDGRACLGSIDSDSHTHTNCHGHSDTNGNQTASGQFFPLSDWIYPIVAVILVSLVGVLCVGIVPLLKKHVFVHLLHFLVALAVGSLTGDALLHLLPHALAPLSHHHGDENEDGVHLDEDEELGLHSRAVWKGMATLFGLFTFFLFERVLGILTDYREQKDQMKQKNRDIAENFALVTNVDAKNVPKPEQFSRSVSQKSTSVGGRRPSRVKRESISYYLSELGECEEGDEGAQADGHSHRGARRYGRTLSEPCREDKDAEVFMTKAATAVSFTIPEESGEEKEGDSNQNVHDSEQPAREHTHTHGGPAGHDHGHSHALPSSLSAMACMVIMGDGLHNLCDGLAIGAAFASSFSAGIGTSVAVLCHELPHELGDFAVLLKDGMSFKRALLFNVVSSVLCFIGMVIGVFVGHLGSVSDWIFCGVAGMFIYISLADMLPQLVDKDTEKISLKVRNLLLQIVGLATGITIMLLIALYEEKIVGLGISE